TLITTLLFLALLISPPAFAGDDATNTSARGWMMLNEDSRAMFVTGYLNGVQLIFSNFGWELRNASSRPMTVDAISERLYRKLLNEPELRGGAVKDVLLAVLNEFATLTDKTGKALPS